MGGVLDEAPVAAALDVYALDDELVAAAPPLRDQLRVSERPPHTVAGGLEDALDADLPVGWGGYLRGACPWFHDSRSLRALEELAEVVEARLQHLAVLRDPGDLVLQPARTEPACPHPSDLLRGNQAGGLEDLHVLLHAREGHVELRGEIADRRVPAPEPLEGGASSRIGERRE